MPLSQDVYNEILFFQHEFLMQSNKNNVIEWLAN